MAVEKKLYSDFSLDFLAHPITKKIRILKDNDAISQALKILILTDKYERLFQPNIFTNVRATLFENFTPTTAEILNDYIYNACRNYEKRANILDLQIIQDDDYNRIGVKITYAGINTYNNIVVSVFLNKIR